MIILGIFAFIMYTLIVWFWSASVWYEIGFNDKELKR